MGQRPRFEIVVISFVWHGIGHISHFYFVSSHSTLARATCFTIVSILQKRRLSCSDNICLSKGKYDEIFAGEDDITSASSQGSDETVHLTSA